MAATATACQALWLKRLLSELTGCEEKRIMLKVDNVLAIALVRNLVFHGRSKHIDIRYHFIRECVENGHINVEHVSGELQRADILTKALPRLKFMTMRQMLRRPPVKLILRINIACVPFLSTSLWGGIPGKVIVFRLFCIEPPSFPWVSSMQYVTHYVLFGSVSSAVPAFPSPMSSNQFENVWMVSHLCSGIPNAWYDLTAGAEKQPLQHFPFSPATNPGNPGRLDAGDDFHGRHVGREKSNGKSLMGYLPGRLSRATMSGPHILVKQLSATVEEGEGEGKGKG
uniref:Zinc finger, CCHC-type n=1 Tax=Tanacetum cinerariifolium TaxID=118510 RepID=A0A699INM1_TANCI|nr:zinc finger, CCHC-type [Tanacetum cinerariifolium]